MLTSVTWTMRKKMVSRRMILDNCGHQDIALVRRVTVSLNLGESGKSWLKRWFQEWNKMVSHRLILDNCGHQDIVLVSMGKGWCDHVSLTLTEDCNVYWRSWLICGHMILDNCVCWTLVRRVRVDRNDDSKRKWFHTLIDTWQLWASR
jgi:hypothetical protein